VGIGARGVSVNDANLIGGRELEQARQQNPLTGRLLQRMINAIVQTATNATVSPLGALAPPPSVGALNIKSSGEIIHATISDSAPIQKGINYFVEYATEPNFLAPHVYHLNASRGHFVTLPSKTDSGAAQNWYARAYSQYPGSGPSRPVYFGGLSPTAITLTGTTQLTPLASTGSGTASPAGGQGGWGLGKIPNRPSQGPKRQVGG
jgi:hypothetical protein